MPGTTGRHGYHRFAAVSEGGPARSKRELVQRWEGGRGRLLLATQRRLLLRHAARHEERKAGKLVSIALCTTGVLFFLRFSMHRPFIKYCMKRVNMLRQKDITPILVFDGGYLPTKANTEKERRE